MAVFLAVFDNQYAKEKQEMLDTTFYKQVTDSKITDAIQTATEDRKSTRLNSSHCLLSRMPSSA